jgi:hypothetical protein
MVLVLFTTASPQVTGQASHGSQLLMTQSTGQLVTANPADKHVALSDRSGHAAPPPEELVRMVRRRVICPSVPQVVSQLDHGSQALTAQSVVHTAVLHADDSDMASHGIPPAAAGVLIVLLLDSVPPPHVTVQGSHGNQDDKAQSTGHCDTAQDETSYDCILHVPVPVAGTETARVLNTVPSVAATLKQDIGHADHSPQSDIWQSDGHSAVSHTLLSNNDGQAAPVKPEPAEANPAGWLTVLVRDVYPEPPHVGEQVAHACHGATTQSWHDEDVNAEHNTSSALEGHSIPPFSGTSMDRRDRVVVAVEQVVPEQGFHADHSRRMQSCGQGSEASHD